MYNMIWNRYTLWSVCFELVNMSSCLTDLFFTVSTFKTYLSVDEIIQQITAQAWPPECDHWEMSNNNKRPAAVVCICNPSPPKRDGRQRAGNCGEVCWQASLECTTQQTQQGRPCLKQRGRQEPALSPLHKLWHVYTWTHIYRETEINNFVYILNYFSK